MALLAPKYSGTELPVYDREESTLTNQKLARFVSEKTFLRPVMVKCGRRLMERGLGDILSKTDTELDRVAGLCGSIVVDREWGLYPLSNDDEARYQLYKPDYPELLRIPPRHLVVAEVHVVKNAKRITPDSAQAQQIIDGIKQYERKRIPWTRSLAAIRHRRLTDMCLDQFILGQTDLEPAETNNKSKLVDIEPRLR